MPFRPSQLVPWRYVSSPLVPIIPAEISWHLDVPFSVAFDAVYYAPDNALEYFQQVYIEGNNLITRWQQLPDKNTSRFTIGETGFGTGVLFLLSWYLWEQYAPKNAQLHFFSCELHPLSVDDLKRALSSWPELGKYAQELIDQYPILTPGFHRLSFAKGRVRLNLMLGDALESFEQLLDSADPQLEFTMRNIYFDAWYLDGFAADKNAAMWSESLIKVIAMLSKQGTSLAASTSSDQVRTHLQEHGFEVNQNKACENAITAIKVAPAKNRYRKPHTPWHKDRKSSYKEKTAIIIGAGLSGCFTAHLLSKSGWQVSIIDELEGIGAAASGNQHAVLIPKLSAYRSPLTQFMQSSFLYAGKIYRELMKEHNIGAMNGSLLLAHNQKELKAQESLIPWLKIYPQLGVFVNEEQASNLAGIPIANKALFIPQSGWINSPELCKILCDESGITLHTNTQVEEVQYENSMWQVNHLKAPVLILASGYKFSQLEQTKQIPIKAIRGQTTYIRPTKASTDLKIPICGEGHVIPAINGLHSIGATYELFSTQNAMNPNDDVANIAKLKKLAPGIDWSNDPVNSWCSVRAATPDYLPLVGPVPQAPEFNELFKGLASDSNRWIPSSGSFYPGLFAISGFGSRGLTTIPLSAEYLVSLINQEINCLPRSIIQAISPARFLRRSIIRNL